MAQHEEVGMLRKRTPPVCRVTRVGKFRSCRAIERADSTQIPADCSEVKRSGVNDSYVGALFGSIPLLMMLFDM